MKLSARHLIAASMWLAAWTAPARSDITVRFETPDVIVGLGQTVDLKILADIPILEPVIGWGIDLTIDDGAIASVVPPPAIGPLWSAALANPDGDGLAGLVPFALPPTNVSGNGVLLATVTLSADAIGETDLFLGATGGDVSEGFALDPFGFANVDYQAGHLTVIPAPSAVVLALLGLPAAAWFKRRS